ncbi:glycosyltransferase [Candidatus Woesearchaeota archaeon]|nr:glycosyltransferase [Candidatus Woesearchaeota archaeon]MBW2994544.1 glycosyltransferase [Candidatus Woesearchaeota archaeon]
MLQHVLWAILFVTLWLTIIWISVLYAEEPKKAKLKRYPKVTIGIPAYNEAKTIGKTVDSIVKADYPKEKLEIIIVNDGSKDNTAKVAQEIIKKNKGYKILLINKANGGKSSAVNAAIDAATGEFFAVVDADSRINSDAIKLVIPHFGDAEVGAVISRVRVDVQSKLLERIQFFEYIMSNMIRKLMAVIGTLAITPGVLSVYRTETLRELGGFTNDRNNLTEDMEIAMRLKYHGYKIEMETKSTTHTLAPMDMKTLWKQRIRWARGYIFNMWKYRSMLFSKKHGLFGVFQMPINILVVFLLITNISIIAYSFIDRMIEFTLRSTTIKGYFWTTLIEIPTLQELFLAQNLRIMIPIIMATVLGFFLILQAHKKFNERVTHNLIGAVGYFLFIPYFTTANWISSIFQEVLKTKRKW